MEMTADQISKVLYSRRLDSLIEKLNRIPGPLPEEGGWDRVLHSMFAEESPEDRGPLLDNFERWQHHQVEILLESASGPTN